MLRSATTRWSGPSVTCAVTPVPPPSRSSGEKAGGGGSGRWRDITPLMVFTSLLSAAGYLSLVSWMPGWLRVEAPQPRMVFRPIGRQL